MGRSLFVEVAIGGVQERGSTLLLSQLDNTIAKNFGKELFISTYGFDHQLIDHFKIRKSIKGFAGHFYAYDNKYDIDGKDGGLKNAQEKTQRFVQQLVLGFNVPEEWIHVWFSGQKGFHVITPDLFGFEPSLTLYEDMKKTVRELCPYADLSIYSYSGLFRAPWSYHPKAEAYKVPVTHRELFDMPVSDIQDIARDPRKTRKGFQLPAWVDVTPMLASERKQAPKRPVIAVSKSGLKTNMTGYVGCMQALWERGPLEGRRHQDCLRLVSSWRRRGLTMEQSNTLLQEWIEHLRGAESKMTPYEVSKIVKDVYERGYSYGCNDPVMMEFCVGTKCLFFKGKNFIEQVVDLSSAVSKMAWNTTQQMKGGFDLSQIYNEEVSYSIRKGEVVVLYGDTKLGKTALFQNWAVVLNQQGYRVLDLSLEMEQDLLTERYCQIKHNLRVDDQKGINEITEMIRKGRMSPDDLAEGLGNIQVMTSSPTVGSIDKMISEHSPDIVLIDPLEDIQLDGGGRYDHVRDQTDVIKGLKDVASRQKVILLIVHHLSKSSASGPGRLHKHSGKGASSIAQKADHLLGFEGDSSSSTRSLRRLASRRPQTLDITLEGDRQTYRFWLASQKEKKLQRVPPTKGGIDLTKAVTL